jgi:glycosyltransferase involved in cell wall biosynthesis
VVLLYSDEPNPHGVAHYNHSLLLALVDAGWTVCSAHPRFESPMIETQRVAGIRHYWTTWNWGQRFVHSMIDCAEPERILAAVNPDLVVFSDCWPISCIAAKHTVIKRNVPYLVVCHSGDLAPGRTFPASLKVVAAQFEQAREVVSVAESSLQVLRQHYRLAPDKGCVIWNGRPATYFEPSNPEVNARLRQQLGLPKNSILCFTAARFDAQKGYQFQFQAIQQFLARKRAVPVYFAWAGTGHLQEQFQAAINQHGLQDRIRLLGHQTNIAEWLGAADIFILTTMLEAMPLSVLEAMAKGTPVIATAVGGIPEELAETGKLLPDPNLDAAGTVAELVDTLEKWAANSGLRKQIGLAGKQRADRFFREEMTIAKTLALIDAVAKGVAAPVGAMVE